MKGSIEGQTTMPIDYDKLLELYDNFWAQQFQETLEHGAKPEKEMQKLWRQKFITELANQSLPFKLTYDKKEETPIIKEISGDKEFTIHSRDHSSPTEQIKFLELLPDNLFTGEHSKSQEIERLKELNASDEKI